jgi:EF-hand domain pair
MQARMTLAALALSVVAAPALAHEAGPGMAPGWFGGGLTEAERTALAEQRFAAADADGNGQISVDEMVAAVEAAMDERRRERITAMFEVLDTDDDGTLTLTELQAASPMPRGPRGDQHEHMMRDGHGGPEGMQRRMHRPESE